MLCADLPGYWGTDFCQGDGGGPLVCEFGGKWYLEGASSWSAGCAHPGRFTVYAKLRYLVKWVNKNRKGFNPAKL